MLQSVYAEIKLVQKGIVYELIFIGGLDFEYSAPPLEKIKTATMHLYKVPKDSYWFSIGKKGHRTGHM